MASTTNPDKPTQRVGAVTGFAIPVGKWRKLSGEPVNGAAATDYLIVPLGAAGRYPADKWAQWGSVRTYRFWKPEVVGQSTGQVSLANVVASTAAKQVGDLRPSQDTRGSGESRYRSGEPCGRRDPLPRLCPLSGEDLEAADGLCALRKKRRCESGQREEGATEGLHPELLDLCSEGGSESSSGGTGSSTSEEDEESDLSGGSRSGSDDERGRSLGLRQAKRRRRLRDEAGLDQSQLGESQEQEDPSSCSSPQPE